jgi:hypothetical protein
VTVTSEVILRDIIGNEKDNIGLFTNRNGMKKEKHKEREDYCFHKSRN